MPIALAVAVAAAFIPTGDYPLGIVSIGVIALVLGFVVCVCLLNVPFFATDEHKALDRTFGPPALVVGILFFLLMVAHVYLTRSSANMLMVIGNTPAVSTIVEVMFNPDSTTWIVSLAFSSVLEAISRTGISQRIELRSAAHLKARFGIEWPIRTAEVSALKLVYLHSLGGTGYVTPIMALCIGCLRAATFSEPRAIIWLDVSPTVKWVVLAQFGFGFVVEAAVWATAKTGFIEFVTPAHLSPGHPLRNTALRRFDPKGYVSTFCLGCYFIYGVFLSFLGPAFVTGMCPNFVPESFFFVKPALLTCTSATAIAGVMNGTVTVLLD